MNVQRIAGVASIAVVAAAVAVGLLSTGSPTEQRALRLDDRRVQDLRRFSQAVDVRWSAMQTLPSGSSELLDGRYLSSLPVDPSTDLPYDYRIVGPREFELCATFDRPSRPEAVRDFWSHDAGRACFTFDVVELRR